MSKMFRIRPSSVNVKNEFGSTSEKDGRGQTIRNIKRIYEDSDDSSDENTVVNLKFSGTPLKKKQHVVYRENKPSWPNPNGGRHNSVTLKQSLPMRGYFKPKMYRSPPKTVLIKEVKSPRQPVKQESRFTDMREQNLSMIMMPPNKQLIDRNNFFLDNEGRLASENFMGPSTRKMVSIKERLGGPEVHFRNVPSKSSTEKVYMIKERRGGPEILLQKPQYSQKNEMYTIREGRGNPILVRKSQSPKKGVVLIKEGNVGPYLMPRNSISAKDSYSVATSNIALKLNPFVVNEGNKTSEILPLMAIREKCSFNSSNHSRPVEIDLGNEELVVNAIHDLGSHENMNNSSLVDQRSEPAVVVKSLKLVKNISERENNVNNDSVVIQSQQPALIQTSAPNEDMPSNKNEHQLVESGLSPPKDVITQNDKCSNANQSTPDSFITLPEPQSKNCVNIKLGKHSVAKSPVISVKYPIPRYEIILGDELFAKKKELVNSSPTNRRRLEKTPLKVVKSQVQNILTFSSPQRKRKANASPTSKADANQANKEAQATPSKLLGNSSRVSNSPTKVTNNILINVPKMQTPIHSQEVEDNMDTASLASGDEGDCLTFDAESSDDENDGVGSADERNGLELPITKIIPNRSFNSQMTLRSPETKREPLKPTIKKASIVLQRDPVIESLIATNLNMSSSFSPPLQTSSHKKTMQANSRIQANDDPTTECPFKKCIDFDSEGEDALNIKVETLTFEDEEMNFAEDYEVFDSYFKHPSLIIDNFGRVVVKEEPPHQQLTTSDILTCEDSDTSSDFWFTGFDDPRPPFSKKVKLPTPPSLAPPKTHKKRGRPRKIIVPPPVNNNPPALNSKSPPVNSKPPALNSKPPSDVISKIQTPKSDSEDEEPQYEKSDKNRTIKGTQMDNPQRGRPPKRRSKGTSFTPDEEEVAPTERRFSSSYGSSSVSVTSKQGASFFRCTLCPGNSGSCCAKLRTAANHSTISSSGKVVLKCQLCDFKTVNEEVLILHKQYHTMNKSYLKCKLCPFKAIRAIGLIRHMDGHTSDDDKSLTCSVCKAGFKSRKTLINHENLVHHVKRKQRVMEAPMRMKCQICPKEFMSIRQLEKHNRKCHKVDEEPVDHHCRLSSTPVKRRRRKASLEDTNLPQSNRLVEEKNNPSTAVLRPISESESSKINDEADEVDVGDDRPDTTNENSERDDFQMMKLDENDWEILEFKEITIKSHNLEGREIGDDKEQTVSNDCQSDSVLSGINNISQNNGTDLPPKSTKTFTQTPNPELNLALLDDREKMVQETDANECLETTADVPISSRVSSPSVADLEDFFSESFGDEFKFIACEGAPDNQLIDDIFSDGITEPLFLASPNNDNEVDPLSVDDSDQVVRENSDVSAYPPKASEGQSNSSGKCEFNTEKDFRTVSYLDKGGSSSSVGSCEKLTSEFSSWSKDLLNFENSDNAKNNNNLINPEQLEVVTPETLPTEIASKKNSNFQHLPESLDHSTLNTPTTSSSDDKSRNEPVTKIKIKVKRINGEIVKGTVLNNSITNEQKLDIRPNSTENNLENDANGERLKQTDINNLITEQNLDGGTIVQNLDGGTIEQNLDGGTIEQNLDGGTIMQNLDGGTIVQNLDGGTIEQNLGEETKDQNLDGELTTTENDKVNDAPDIANHDADDIDLGNPQSEKYNLRPNRTLRIKESEESTDENEEKADKDEENTDKNYSNYSKEPYSSFEQPENSKIKPMSGNSSCLQESLNQTTELPPDDSETHDIDYESAEESPQQETSSKLTQRVKMNCFSCCYCDFRTDKLYKLYNHLEEHDYMNPFECSFCPKSFSQVLQLKLHIKDHDEEFKRMCKIAYRSPQLLA